MRERFRALHVHSPLFFFGAFFGFHAVIATLVVIMFVSGAVPVSAAQAPSPGLSKCFYRSECLKKKTPDNESCDIGCATPGTTCHCFEPRGECLGGGGYCYQKWPAIKLSIPIDGKDVTLDLADYIAKLYNYGVALAAILAGVLFVVGGAQWMTAISGGQVEEAKKRIFGAGIGLLLALGAITLLYTVNPDTVALRLPKVPIIKKATYTPFCASTAECVTCGRTYVIGKPKDAPPDWKPPAGCSSVVFRPQDGDPTPGCSGCKKWSDDLSTKLDLTNECTGKGCASAGCGADANTRCQVPKQGDNPASACPPKPPGAAAVTMVCKACMKTTDTCSPDGQNDQCCGGFCAKGKCTNGELGDACENGSACKSGLCQTKRGNSCSAGLTGAPCSDDEECRNGNVCVDIVGLKVCLPPKSWGFCGSDAQCADGTKCRGTVRGGATKAVASAGATALTGGLGGFITAAVFTTEAYCLPDAGPGTCLKNSSCPTGYCLTKSQICSDKKTGSPCNGAGDCESGKCIDSAATITTPLAPNGICSAGEYGERCDKNADCVSNHCYAAGDFGACVTGELDSGCDTKSGCVAGLKCDAGLKRCIK